MSQLMLINPSKRPSKRRKPRTAAQKAATKRMLSARSAKRPAKRSSTGRALAAVKSRIKSRRKNPIGGNIVSMFMPVAKGALGAVTINTLEHQVISGFMPDALKTDMGKYGVRIALALVVGTLGGKVIGQANARQAAEGALVVALHDVIVTSVNKMLPATTKVQLAAYAPDDASGMGAYAPTLSGVQAGTFEYTS